MNYRSIPSHRRGLGQNFLRSRRVARLFAQWACNYRKILEIGVGRGFLTSEVLRSCNPLILVGVEVDYRLREYLAMIKFYYVGFEGVLADILHYGFRENGVEAVYGSIPYAITGPLLSLLSTRLQLPAMLMVQREVADRLAARPGTSSYGRLTILVRMVYNVRLGPLVPPSAFKPKPRVASRIVYLTPRGERIEEGLLARVEALTRCLFSERNKLADKVASKCIGVSRDELGWLKGKRVFEIGLRDVERLVAMMG